MPIEGPRLSIDHRSEKPAGIDLCDKGGRACRRAGRCSGPPRGPRSDRRWPAPTPPWPSCPCRRRSRIVGSGRLRKHGGFLRSVPGRSALITSHLPNARHLKRHLLHDSRGTLWRAGTSPWSWERHLACHPGSRSRHPRGVERHPATTPPPSGARCGGAHPALSSAAPSPLAGSCHTVAGRQGRRCEAPARKVTLRVGSCLASPSGLRFSLSLRSLP